MGLGEIENCIDEYEEKFTRILLQAVADEIDYESIKHIGLTIIYKNKLSNYKFLESLIILQGVLLIRLKKNPRIVNLILESYINTVI